MNNIIYIYLFMQAVLALVGFAIGPLIKCLHFKAPSLVNDGKSRQEKPAITSDSFSHWHDFRGEMEFWSAFLHCTHSYSYCRCTTWRTLFGYRTVLLFCIVIKINVQKSRDQLELAGTCVGFDIHFRICPLAEIEDAYNIINKESCSKGCYYNTGLLG